MQTVAQSPNKPSHDVTFARRFLRGKRMTACEQIRVRPEVVDCFSDPGFAEFDVVWFFIAGSNVFQMWFK